MKKVLSLIASPRKSGNSEIMVKEISRHIKEPHELYLLRLSDFNIMSCKACYSCLFEEKPCIQNDDLYKVLKPVLEADALIVAAPTYFFGPNSGLKRLLDRGLSFYAHGEKLWGKPSIGVGIAGIYGKEGYTLLGIENFLTMILSEIKMTSMVYGALPGEIFLDEQNLSKAGELASALFNNAEEKNDPCCPVCAGQTFRFEREGRVKCMLCSNQGTFETLDNSLRFHIQPGEHDLFLTREHALEHRNWLLEMKQRYLDKKNDLKKICKEYRKEGRWIKP